MKRKKKSKRSNLRDVSSVPSDIQKRVLEMKGHLDIAMHGEALDAARAILSHGELDAESFDESVRVILVAEKDWKRWEATIKAAYAGLSKQEQERCADSMAGFYATIDDAESAATFIRSDSVHPVVLSQDMDILLKLKRLDSAKTLFARCRRVLNKTHDSFERSMLLTSMAEYSEQVGDLEAAERFWTESSELDEPLLRHALSGLVRIQAVRALSHVKEGIERIEKFWTQGHDKHAIMLPGNHDQLLADARKELEGYRAALLTIVLPDELCQFGIERE